MARSFRRCRRASERTARGALAGAALSAVAIGVGACLTAPPPDLPSPSERPIILHTSVVPPPDQVLTEWPEGGEFVVPVEIEDPNETFSYNVFIDYDPSTGTAPPTISGQESANGNIDGGIVTVSVTILPAPDPAFCHHIEFVVAASFNLTAPHTPTSAGGDEVEWVYSPGSPNGCPVYDAGAFQDGAFPTDVATDGLPVLADGGAGL